MKGIFEDFYNENVETIVVSTMHKAKGREFDDVFLLLDQFNPITDEAKRLLYVAMTRAKRSLNIHMRGNFLDFIKVNELQIADIKETFPPPPEITMQLTYSDVWLSFFNSVQQLISQFRTGDQLSVSSFGCQNSRGQTVLRFSKKFIQEIEKMKQNHYRLKSGKIRYIVYWKEEDAEKEIRIILPELFFEDCRPT